MDKIEEILTRGVANIIPSKEGLEKILRSGRRLNIYLGIDPTATKIHLGNAVPLRKLQAFVELGHNVTFLIGDFTALIGDTSDKESERPILTYEQITKNYKTYKKQASKIVDFSKVKIKFNSSWLKKLSFTDVVRLCQNFSLNDFIGRELIKKRLEKGKSVRLDEVLYPVMQGYDSLQLDTDIQIGGPDQTFNMQAGRTLLEKKKGKESFILVTGYLEGTDGRKMSKSWGNAIWLNDEPKEMFGKVMSIKDDLIINYFILATNLSSSEIEKEKDALEQGKNPMFSKRKLAYQIVKELHSETEAKEAEEYFENTFQKRIIPKTPEEVIINKGSTLLDVVAKFSKSKTNSKRLFEQGAIEVNGKVIKNSKLKLSGGEIVKIGKKKFIKIVIV